MGAVNTSRDMPIYLGTIVGTVILSVLGLAFSGAFQNPAEYTPEPADELPDWHDIPVYVGPGDQV